MVFNPSGQQIAANGQDGTPKIWNIDGDPVAEFGSGFPAAVRSDWQAIAILIQPSYFGTAFPDDAPEITNLYPIDLFQEV